MCRRSPAARDAPSMPIQSTRCRHTTESHGAGGNDSECAFWRTTSANARNTMARSATDTAAVSATFSARSSARSARIASTLLLRSRGGAGAVHLVEHAAHLVVERAREELPLAVAREALAHLAPDRRERLALL